MLTLSYREAQEKWFSEINSAEWDENLGSWRKMQAHKMEFETIAEKFRASFIGNQQTTVATLNKYVAEVTAAVE
jgi:hypothetical protein